MPSPQAIAAEVAGLKLTSAFADVSDLILTVREQIKFARGPRGFPVHANPQSAIAFVVTDRLCDLLLDIGPLVEKLAAEQVERAEAIEAEFDEQDRAANEQFGVGCVKHPV